MPSESISLAQLGKGFEVLKALKRLVSPASTTLTTLAEVTSVGGGATSASASFHDEDGCQAEGNTGKCKKPVSCSVLSHQTLAYIILLYIIK